MAHRKNTKRIDPRHFLHETTNREEEILQEEPPPGLVATADAVPVAAPEESESRVDRVLDWLLGALERATEGLTEDEISVVTQELARQTAPGAEVDIGPGGALEENAEE